ncbi:ABC transporter permease [Nocardia sp. NPDC005978]|uniref:ABC transporter permease n=1 Tax=unclassified Nocardia TaxID=2637762 RepID=UPI0033B75579
MNRIVVPEPVLRAARSEARKAGSLRVNQALGGLVPVLAVLAFATLGLMLDRLPSEDEDKVISAAGWPGLFAAVAMVAAVLAAGVFGALSAGAEYQYGSLALTALYTRDRNVLLGAKTAVVAAISLAIVVLAEALAVGALLLFGRDRVQLGSWLFAVLAGVALAAVCWSVLGTALGFLLRSPVRALAVGLAVVLLEPLLWLIVRAAGIPGVAAVLPVSATLGTMTSSEFTDGGLIAPTPAAIVVLLLWTAAAAGAAWWFTTTRDL